MTVSQYTKARTMILNKKNQNFQTTILFPKNLTNSTKGMGKYMQDATNNVNAQHMHKTASMNTIHPNLTYSKISKHARKAPIQHNSAKTRQEKFTHTTHAYLKLHSLCLVPVYQAPM